MENIRALGALPPDPRASGGWGLCPQTPSLRRPQTPKTSPPHCEFLATRLIKLMLVSNKKANFITSVLVYESYYFFGKSDQA